MRSNMDVKRCFMREDVKGLVFKCLTVSFLIRSLSRSALLAKNRRKRTIKRFNGERVFGCKGRNYFREKCKIRVKY